MKYNYKIIMIIIAVLFIGGCGSNSEYQEMASQIQEDGTFNNYEYKIIDEEKKEAALVKIHNYGEKVVIPNEIEGYNIIEIGADDNCVIDENDNKIQSLIISEGIKTINSFAFGSMKELSELDLPGSLNLIKCGNFTDINIDNIELKNDMYWTGAFNGSKIGTIVVDGKFIVYNSGEYGDEEEYFSDCEIENITYTENAILPLKKKIYYYVTYATPVKKVVMPKETKQIYFEYGDVDNLILYNPEIQIDGGGYSIAKVKYIFENIEKKYNKKTAEYEYEVPNINPPFESYVSEDEENGMKQKVKKSVKLIGEDKSILEVTYSIKKYCKKDGEWKEYRNSFIE